MTSIRITTTQNVELEYEIASLGDRVLGYIIDAVIQFFVIMGLYITLEFFRETLLNDDHSIIGAIVTLSTFMLVGFYDLVLEVTMNGQSVGKRIMKTRVVNLDGTKPTLGSFFLRWLLRIVDFSLCSGLVALVAFLSNRKGQRVGDMAAGTTVIKLKERVTVEEVAAPPFPLNYLPIYPEVKLLKDADVSRIKDVLHTAVKQNNNEAITTLANKIKDLLNVTSSLDDREFIETIIKDYYYFVSE